MDHREICGLLIDNGCFLHPEQTRNIARRRGSFLLDGRQIWSVQRAAQRLNLTIAGTFRSHLYWFATPAASDIRGAPDDSLMLIIDSMDRKVRLWRIHNKRAYPLNFRLI